MEEDFISWLNEQLNHRGWTSSELARRAEVVPSTVSMIMSGRSNPGAEFCVGVARALKIPPEEVFRRAGLLPDLPDVGDGRVIYEMQDIMKRLPQRVREDVRDYAVWRYKQVSGEIDC